MVGPKQNVEVVAVTRQTATPAQAGGDSLLEWSQQFTEGPIHEPLPSNQREMTLHKKKNLMSLLRRKRSNESKTNEQAHCVYSLSEGSELRNMRNDQSHKSRMSEPNCNEQNCFGYFQQFGEAMTADHKVFAWRQ